MIKKTRKVFDIYFIVIMRLVAKSFFHLGIIITGFFIYDLIISKGTKLIDLAYITLFYTIALLGETTTKYMDSPENLKQKYRKI